MLMRSHGRTLAALGIVAVLAGAAQTAHATQKFGPLEISGNLASVQIIRHPDITDYQFIQQRNTLKVRIDWEWIQGGNFLDRFDFSEFIEKSNLFLLYRGVY